MNMLRTEETRINTISLFQSHMTRWLKIHLKLSLGQGATDKNKTLFLICILSHWTAIVRCQRSAAYFLDIWRIKTTRKTKLNSLAVHLMPSHLGLSFFSRVYHIIILLQLRI